MTQTPNNLTDPTDFVRRAAPQDLVADVLATVRLSGAVFLRAEYTEPWAYESTSRADLIQILQLRPQRLILFHIITEGKCWLRLSSGEELRASAGDVVILPYSHQHIMSSSAGPKSPISIAAIMPPPPFEPVSMIRYGGGGTRTSVVCGYLQCDDPIFDPVISTLPPLFSVRPPAGPTADWVAASIQYALNATTGRRPTSQSVAVRLPELLLSEVLRLYIENEPQVQTGWLAALRDPVVGPALIELHGDPARKWTVEELSRCVASSRSTLNERFGRLIGRAPMQYLSDWRLQLAADLLRKTTSSILSVALHVGYESEEAFNRAFKRALGSPPAQWRQRAIDI